MSKTYTTKHIGLVGWNFVNDVPTFLHTISDNNEKVDSYVGEMNEDISKNTSDIVAIKEDVKNLSPEGYEELLALSQTNANNIQGLTTRITDDEDNIAEQRKAIDQLQGDYSKLNEQVGDMQDSLDIMSTNLSKVQADIASNTSSIQKINSDIDDIMGSLNNINGYINTINTQMNTMSNQISNLQNRMTTSESKIIDLDTRVKQLEGGS